ncbi:hypothetical protein, partial [Mycoplasmopsis bovis]|uniref:hypothetical protein n=1 Tax=Mycoplasmopsis bovis TaxID=28903 RepID=UPI003D2BC59B
SLLPSFIKTKFLSPSFLNPNFSIHSLAGIIIPLFSATQLLPTLYSFVIFLSKTFINKGWTCSA